MKDKYLKEFIVQDIVAYIAHDTGIEYDEAMNRFYSSLTFEKLQDSETGLYIESPAYVYGIYLNECRTGTLENVPL